MDAEQNEFICFRKESAVSVSTLETAISLYSECLDLDFMDYEDTRNEDILFIYDMIQNKGEAKTIEWLIENEFIQ